MPFLRRDRRPVDFEMRRLAPRPSPAGAPSPIRGPRRGPDRRSPRSAHRSVPAFDVSRGPAQGRRHRQPAGPCGSVCDFFRHPIHESARACADARGGGPGPQGRCSPWGKRRAARCLPALARTLHGRGRLVVPPLLRPGDPAPIERGFFFSPAAKARGIGGNGRVFTGCGGPVPEQAAWAARHFTLFRVPMIVRNLWPSRMRWNFKSIPLAVTVRSYTCIS